MSTIVGGLLAVLFLPFPWWLVVVSVLALKDALEIWVWLRWRRRPPTSGTEGMVGERGTLLEGGRVRIRGTSYPARVLGGSPGDPVRVEGVEGMTLVVRRAAS